MNYFQLPAELMSKVMELSRSNCTRGDKFSFMVGRAMAYRAKMNPDCTKEENCRSALNVAYEEMVSEINTLLPLNITKVRDFTKAWSGFRHNAIEGCIDIPYAREGSENEDFFGISRHFDQAILKDIRECGDEFTRSYTVLNTLICHIDSRKKGSSNE